MGDSVVTMEFTNRVGGCGLWIFFMKFQDTYTPILNLITKKGVALFSSHLA